MHGAFFKLISAATYSPTNTLRSTIGEGLAEGFCDAGFGMAFEGVCLNTPKNVLQMFCAFLMQHEKLRTFPSSCNWDVCIGR